MSFFYVLSELLNHFSDTSYIFYPSSACLRRLIVSTSSQCSWWGRYRARVAFTSHRRCRRSKAKRFSQKNFSLLRAGWVRKRFYAVHAVLFGFWSVFKALFLFLPLPEAISVISAVSRTMHKASASFANSKKCSKFHIVRCNSASWACLHKSSSVSTTRPFPKTSSYFRQA